MEALSLHTGVRAVYWEDNTSCIYVIEAKIVTPRVKNIETLVYFLKEQIFNGLFVQKIW